MPGSAFSTLARTVFALSVGALTLFNQRAGLDVLPSKARYLIPGLRDPSNPRSTDAALRSTLQGNQPPATEEKEGADMPRLNYTSRFDISH